MERSSEIGNNLNESVKINVEKNNGIKERFSYEKLVKSLVMVETPFFESDKIVATVELQPKKSKKSFTNVLKTSTQKLQTNT